MFCKIVSLLTLVLTLGGNRLDTGKLLLSFECNDLYFFNVIWINPIYIGFNKKKDGIDSSSKDMENFLNSDGDSLPLVHLKIMLNS